MLKMGIKNKILKRVPKQKYMWISRKNKRENNYDIIFVLNNSKKYHAAIRFKKGRNLDMMLVFLLTYSPDPYPIEFL
jgi:transposase